MSLLLLAAAAAVLPAPVRAFVDRAETCRHWAGEEPYDRDRAAEIARAVRSLRCDRIEQDGEALRRRYRGVPGAGAAIDGALAE